MDILQYSDEHHAFRQRLKTFLAKEVTPNVDQWEKDHIVPKEAWQQMGREGFLCTWASPVCTIQLDSERLLASSKNSWLAKSSSYQTPRVRGRGSISGAGKSPSTTTLVGPQAHSAMSSSDAVSARQGALRSGAKVIERDKSASIAKSELTHKCSEAYAGGLQV